MDLLCIGLSYRTAPLQVRERLALPEARQVELLQQLAQAPTEALFVSTCNRVELYLSAPDLAQARARAHEALSRLGGTEALEHLYEHQGAGALEHLFRVASSLDSMVVGEAQILGQVRAAIKLGQGAGAVRGVLTRVCDAASSCAKRVRSETAIGRAAVSMASAAVVLASSKVFETLKDKTVLVVGAGEMARLAALHLKQAKAGRILIVNRTQERAAALAAEVGGTARPFVELHALLNEAHMVMCATASPEPLFTKASVEAVRKTHSPLYLFVDLSVPPNVAPDVAQLERLLLYNVDNIGAFVKSNEKVRDEEAQKAGVLVTQAVTRFMVDQAVRNGGWVLARLRKRANQIAAAEVERTLDAVGEGLTDKQRKSIEAMGQAIVNKLLHEPSTRLRAVGPEDESNRLAGAAAELFGLSDEPPSPPSSDPESGAPSSVSGGKR